MSALEFNRIPDLLLATLPPANSAMAQRLRALYAEITNYVAGQIPANWGPLSWEQEEAIYNLCSALAMFQSTAYPATNEMLAVLRTRYRETRAAFYSSLLDQQEYTLLGMIADAAHAIQG